MAYMNPLDKPSKRVESPLSDPLPVEEVVNTSTDTPQQAAQQMGLTNDQMLVLINAFKEMIQEVKKPSELEQRKLDEQARREKQALQNKIKIQIANAKAKEQLKLRCPHGTVHPGTGAFKHAWRAQVNSNGYFIPMCIQCQTQLKPIKATFEQIQNGVNLHEYPGLTAANLERWAADVETAPVPRVPEQVTA